MEFGFSTLDKQTDEGLLQFDNRISHMLPVVSGTAYFSAENYNPYAGEFGIFIEWKPEINNRLNDRLPAEGYFIKATNLQALELCDLPDGLPVYMKLISREGRLYPYRTYLMANGRPYSVEFNANQLVHIEDNTAANVEAPKEKVQGSQRKLISGSQRKLRFGSQRFLLSGSQGRLLLGGSQRNWTHEWEWEYETGSQRSLFGSQRYLFGSNRGLYKFSFGGSQRSFWLGGSQRNWTHEWEWEYETGSQRGLFGSQRYLFGSNRGLYALSGSQRSLIAGSNRGLYALGGSQRYLTGSQRALPCIDNAWIGDMTPDLTDIPYWRYVPKEWQLINESRRPGQNKGGNGKLGYGLDLI